MVEQEYYPIVRKWLEKQGYYCGGLIEDSKGEPFYFQNRGTRRLRIDVAGVKNHGTRSLDEIEVVAVEVRDITSVQYRDIQDACAYSQYANKCYLATTGSISEEDKHQAQCLGVGLLGIDGDKVKELLSPRINAPIQARMLHFLSVLEISQCPICQTFFETYRQKAEKYKSFYRLRRPRYFDIARDYPNANMSDMFTQKELRKLPQKYKTRCYICRSCIEELFPDKIGKENNEEE